MKKFWNFKNASPERGELYLYGAISDESWFDNDVTPAQFSRDLAALGDIKTLDVFINSPGGDVFAGQTIYNILKHYITASVTTHIDGIAASAASIIAMAGDKIVMPENATLMIHNAWTYSAGNKDDLRKMADTLELIDTQIAEVYAARTGGTVEDMAALMDAETWMSGTEAVEKGFADELEENKKVAACADAKILARYKHPPEIEENKEPEAADNSGFSVPKNEPDNGGESQPVADTTLADQRKHFYTIKRKLLEV